MTTISTIATEAAERTPGAFLPQPSPQVVEFWAKQLPGMVEHCRNLAEIPSWIDHFQQKHEPPAGETPLAGCHQM